MNIQRDHPNLIIWMLCCFSAIYLLVTLLVFIILSGSFAENEDNPSYCLSAFCSGISRILLNGTGIAVIRMFRAWRGAFWVKSIHFVIHTTILVEIIVMDLELLFGTGQPPFRPTDDMKDVFLWRIAMYLYIFLFACSLHSYIFRPGITSWSKAAYNGCHALFSFMVFLFFVIEYLGKWQAVIIHQKKPMSFIIQALNYMVMTSVLFFCHCVFYVVINPYFE